MIKIYVDGGSFKKRICLVDGDTTIVKTRKDAKTNNELEYLAAIYGVEYSKTKYPDEYVTIYSDSKLVVNQIENNWKINNQNLWMLAWSCSEKMTDTIKLKWCPRDYNLAGVHLENLYVSDKSNARHRKTRRGDLYALHNKK